MVVVVFGTVEVVVVFGTVVVVVVEVVVVVVVVVAGTVVVVTGTVVVVVADAGVANDKERVQSAHRQRGAGRRPAEPGAVPRPRSPVRRPGR